MYMFSVTYFLTLLSRGMSICGTQPDIMVFLYSIFVEPSNEFREHLSTAEPGLKTILLEATKYKM